jgi:hypothetical protein
MIPGTVTYSDCAYWARFRLDEDNTVFVNELLAKVPAAARQFTPVTTAGFLTHMELTLRSYSYNIYVKCL